MMMPDVIVKSFKKNKAQKMRVSNGNHLSEREREIIALVADGFTAQEIAKNLFVSLDTVETHKRNVLRKLKANNAAHAVAKAVRGKLI